MEKVLEHLRKIELTLALLTLNLEHLSKDVTRLETRVDRIVDKIK